MDHKTFIQNYKIILNFKVSSKDTYLHCHAGCGYGRGDFASKIIGIMGYKSNKQNAGIIGATLSKIHFISYNNFTKAEILFRMLNSWQPLPNYLFVLSNKLEKIDIL